MSSEKNKIIQPTIDLGELRNIGNGPHSFLERAQYVNSLPKDRIHKKRVIIFSTMRSGSTFLSDQIASSGLVGAPDEWIEPIWLNTLNIAKYATNVVEALEWAASRTSTINGVFSINVQINHYIHWKKKGFDLLKWGFDDAIYLERKDKLSQAYSLAKARTYNKWDQTKTPDNEVTDKHNVPLYAVLKALSDIYFWSEYFEKVLKPHTSKTILYEDYLNNPQIILDLIAQLSGICLNSLPLKSKLKKQQTDKDRAAIESLRTKIQL